MRYLLEGSVRRVQDRVRISAQLIDAEASQNLWGDKFDGPIEDVFDLQDRITANVIGAIEPSLRGAEIARAERKRPENLGAYDLYLRALSHAYDYSREGRSLALELLNKALAMDPDYAEAHGLAAWCHIQRVWTESPELSADLASALAHARAVMTIRSDDASTLAFAANAYARAARDYEMALEMIEHALARNPSNAHALASVPWLTPGWEGPTRRSAWPSAHCGAARLIPFVTSHSRQRHEPICSSNAQAALVQREQRCMRTLGIYPRTAMSSSAW